MKFFVCFFGVRGVGKVRVDGWVGGPISTQKRSPGSHCTVFAKQVGSLLQGLQVLRGSCGARDTQVTLEILEPNNANMLQERAIQVSNLTWQMQGIQTNHSTISHPS